MIKLKLSWTTTPVTEFIHTRLPLIQAPMAGGATTPALVAAVSNAGGLGSFAAGYLSADEIKKSLSQIRTLTPHPFAVNLFIPEIHFAHQDQILRAKTIVQEACHELQFDVSLPHPPYAPLFEEQLDVIIEEQIPILSFTFGVLSESWIKKLKSHGIILIGTATTLEEAKILEKNNIDFIVAQGKEAGGHRGTFLGKAEEALIEINELTKLFTAEMNTPIIAAGGIMNAKNIFDQLTLGASAVQMGTAFLCCNESGIHPDYKKILLSQTQDETVLTRAFSGKLARGIKNKFTVRMQPHEHDLLDYPIQNALTKGMRKEAEKQNDTEFMSLWAGQFAYLCETLSAEQLVQQLDHEIACLCRNDEKKMY